MLSFQQELLPFALTIQRLILQIFDSTQQFDNASLKSVRLLAYEKLALWLTFAKSSSGFQLIADEFITHILEDISSTNRNILVLNTKVIIKIVTNMFAVTAAAIPNK